jgi:hypothetical protein
MARKAESGKQREKRLGEPGAGAVAGWYRRGMARRAKIGKRREEWLAEPRAAEGNGKKSKKR